jgi:hypothetical protein
MLLHQGVNYYQAVLELIMDIPSRLIRKVFITRGFPVFGFPNRLIQVKNHFLSRSIESFDLTIMYMTGCEIIRVPHAGQATTSLYLYYQQVCT